MSADINKESLEHLASLARMELSPEEEAKLLKDLRNILAHFEELQKLDLQEVEPMTGGTLLKNAFRDDEERHSTNQGRGKNAFPKEHRGFLKVPPVFE